MHNTIRIGKKLLISILILIVFALPGLAAENEQTIIETSDIMATDQLIYIPPDTIWPPVIIVEPSNIKLQISQQDTMYSQVNIYNYNDLMGTITGGEATKIFTFPNGGDYKIEAMAEKGYIFDKFCDAINNCVTTNPIIGNINSVGDYLTYTAYFKPEIIPPSTIEIQALPASAGKSKINIYKNGVIIGYVNSGAKSQTFTFPNGGNYKIEPIAQIGYVFDKFCDNYEECVITNVLSGYVSPTGDYLSYIGYFKVDPNPPPTPTPTPIVSCDPSYPDFCIPPPPPDLNCPNIPQKGFKVLPPDPHGFDADKDGIGCESPTPTTPTPTPIPPTPTPTPIPPTPTPTPVQGDILAYYRGLGMCVSTTETNDLLKGADDWRVSIVPPGFYLSLTTKQLLILADEWRVSPPNICAYN